MKTEHANKMQHEKYHLQLKGKLKNFNTKPSRARSVEHLMTATTEKKNKNVVINNHGQRQIDSTTATATILEKWT